MFTGKEIYEKRIKLGWSAQDLAKRLEAKISNVYKWEQGMKPSDHDMVVKIQDWLKSEKEKTIKKKRTIGKHRQGVVKVNPIVETNGVDWKSKYYELLPKYVAALEKLASLNAP